MEPPATTRALTTLSPILPERLRELTTRLKVVRYTPGIGRPLIQLAFIHYARWIVFDWLPPARGTGGWRGLRWKYLLFESNYDGSQDDYLRTFADVVPARLSKLWGACFGFDTMTRTSDAGSMLAAGGFREFVDRNQLEVLEFFAAYRTATATDVRQALALHELGADVSRTSGPEPMASIRDLASTVLGPVPPRLSAKQRLRALVDPWANAVRGKYGVNPLSIVTPLPDDQADALRAAAGKRPLLKGLEDTNTHFARLVILPSQLADLGQPSPDVLECPYLLFTSDAWGTTYDQIEVIRTSMGDTADLLWGPRDGYPGHDDRNRARFHAWVDSHTLHTAYYVAGYPPHPVSTIERRLEARARIADGYALQPHPPLTEVLAKLDPGHG